MISEATNAYQIMAAIEMHEMPEKLRNKKSLKIKHSVSDIYVSECQTFQFIMW